MLTARSPLRRLLDALHQVAATAPVPAARRWPVVLVGLLILGVAARFRFFLSAPSYWYDEAYVLLNVFGRTFGGLVGPIDHNQVAPPVFLWLERAAYLLIGPGERAMRLPAFAAGLAAVAVMIPLGRRVVGGWAWWLPAALAAVSRAAVRHGGEVKPYTFDLLGSAAVLLAVAAFVRARAAGATGRAAAVGLLAAAAIAPWASLPTGFALGGAVAALFVHALHSRRTIDWRVFAGVAVLAAVSAGSLWWFHARHLYYPGMKEFWSAAGEGGFPDWDRLRSLLLWPVTAMNQTARHATREVGVLLLPLALLGTVRLWRANPALAVATVGPIVLAVAASCAGKYPLANRTTLCLFPGLWVAAAAGVGEVAERFALRRLALLLCAALLVHGTGDTLVSAVRPHAFPPAREALRDVRAARRPGDVMWVSHVEVDRVYHGPDRTVFGDSTPPASVIESAAGGRVWVVVYPCPFPVRTPAHALADALRATGYREAESRPHRGMAVTLYAR